MRYVEWVDCLKRGSLSVSVFVMCECGTCTKETKNERASCKLGSLVLYCGLFTLVRNLCSLALSLYWHMLTMPKSASMVHSHTRTTLDSVYKLKSYEFEFQSIFFLFILGWFVCLLQHHSFPSASFFVTLGLPLSAATQLLKSASPTHFNYYFCFSRPKKLRRLKSYTNKLNWIYLSSGNESE